MEASLMQVYSPRDPLAEVLRGEISVRKFRVMVEGIPRTSATPIGRALNGPWSDTEWLLRHIARILMSIDVNYYNRNRSGDAALREFEDIDAPDLTEYQLEAKNMSTPEDDDHRAASDEWLLKVLNDG